MSADNGIYIGAFPKTEGSTEYEYRVIHAQAIDNVYWTPDDSLEENPREIVQYFGKAEVMTEEFAHKKAFEMEKEILNDEFCPILEYGISTMTFNRPFKYYEEHAHEIKYKWDPETV